MLGALVNRLAERHERRVRTMLAEALRLVRSLTGDGAGPLYARSAHRSEYPPGTLSGFARSILAACDDRVPIRAPGQLVRS